MRHQPEGLGLACAVMLLSPAPAPGEEPAPARAFLGGTTTVFTEAPGAFGQSAANLPLEGLVEFAAGNRVFNTTWTMAGSSVELFDGVGPLFNRASCSSCHVHDGRGQPPTQRDQRLLSMVIRLGAAGDGAKGSQELHSIYGKQLQVRANPGSNAEADVELEWDEMPGVLPDGERYSLRRPRWLLKNWSHGDPGELLVSARVAPAVFGLGLIEAIPEEAILALADEGDANGDGISGRPNRAGDQLGKTGALGRFGWKAAEPTLRQQMAGAFREDMGLTTSIFSEDGRTAAQREGAPVLEGGSPEVEDRIMDQLEFYLRVLAVPGRRRLNDARALRGEDLFERIGCAACHAPSFETGCVAPIEVAHQKIYPYTDLLLHDMGEGLADGRPEHAASGREWRTPPLWGMGLQPVVNKHRFLLHDGRARGLLEAILWHGGEAEAARDRFGALQKRDRDDLLEFLSTL